VSPLIGKRIEWSGGEGVIVALAYKPMDPMGYGNRFVLLVQQGDQLTLVPAEKVKVVG
jgi:hypothetical protein